MQVDEALGKVTDPEVRNFLDGIIKNQNSYTTKLEAQLKDLQSKNQSNPGGAGLDEDIVKFYAENMRQQIIAKAEVELKKLVTEEIFNAIRADWIDFLDKTMSREKKNVSEKYATDAFSLVYGQCLMKPDHPVNKIGKATPPSGTPNPNINIGTNGQSVQKIQDIIQPPIMTGADGSAQKEIPTPGANPIKNTRDAFSSLKSKIAQNGGGRFQ